MFVGHLMPGPPAASLWEPVVMLDRRGGDELIDLLEERIALLGLDAHGDNVLDVAMESAALEITRMLVPALRSDPGAHRAAPSAPRTSQRRRLCLRAERCALRLARGRPVASLRKRLPATGARSIAQARSRSGRGSPLRLPRSARKRITASAQSGAAARAWSPNSLLEAT